MLHELLHVYLQEMFEVDKTQSSDVIEGMVNGLEVATYNYLIVPARAHQLESWTRAIQRKLT